MIGTLFVIPCDLGSESLEEVLPPSVAKAIRSVDLFVGEEEKSLRRFIKKITPDRNQQDLKILLLNEHSKPSDLEECVAALSDGRKVGLVSEAGCPVIADPGSPLVSKAHQIGAKVIPLVGPSSVVLALMASGFSGQRFRFLGYLPKEEDRRKETLKQIEKDLIKFSETQVFIETPYRNNQLLKSIIECCSKDIFLSVALSLTTKQEKIITKKISEWAKAEIIFDKEPAVFLLGN